MFTWLLGGEITSQIMFGVDSHPPGWSSPDGFKGWKSHPVEEVVHIMRGKIRYQFGRRDGSVAEDTIAEPGDTIYVAKGVKHRAKVEGTDSFLGVCFWPRALPKDAGYLTKFTPENPPADTLTF